MAHVVTAEGALAGGRRAKGVDAERGAALTAQLSKIHRPLLLHVRCWSVRHGPLNTAAHIYGQDHFTQTRGEGVFFKQVVEKLTTEYDQYKKRMEEDHARVKAELDEVGTKKTPIQFCCPSRALLILSLQFCVYVCRKSFGSCGLATMLQSRVCCSCMQSRTR